MKIKSSLIFIHVLVAVGMVFSSMVWAYDSGDFQYWNTNESEWKAAKDWKLSVGEDLRWGDGASELYYTHTDMGLTYSGMAKWLDIRAGYRLAFTKDKKEWKYENRPNFTATLKYDVLGFKLSDRNRIEYRDIEDKKHSWRYRNRLQVKYPFTFDKVVLAPYMADEIFLDCSNRGELTRNRLYSGIELGMFKHIVVDIYYLWQTSKGKSGWTDYNILGTKVKIVF
jgi:hypothetical protein